MTSFHGSLRRSFPLVTAFAVVGVPALIVACGGRGPLDDNIDAYDAPDAEGINPSSGSGGGSGSSGLDASSGSSGKKDGGGSTTKDAGGGTPTKDSGLPGFPGLPGLSEDAGGIAGCFACAEDSCGTQTNACLSSPDCLQEGLCDLTTCLLGAAGGTGSGSGSTSGGLGGIFGGADLQCLQTCSPSAAANTELLSAVECVFTQCGSDCLSALSAAGSGGGLGGLGGLGGGGGGGLGGLGGLLGGDTTATTTK